MVFYRILNGVELLGFGNSRYLYSFGKLINGSFDKGKN